MPEPGDLSQNSRYLSGCGKEINRTFFCLRLIRLIALTSGVRMAETFGRSNIRMKERYPKLAKNHVARSGSTARKIWNMMAGEAGENVQATA